MLEIVGQQVDGLIIWNQKKELIYCNDFVKELFKLTEDIKSVEFLKKLNKTQLVAEIGDTTLQFKEIF